MTLHTVTFLKRLNGTAVICFLTVFFLPALALNPQNDWEDTSRFICPPDHQIPIEWPDFGPDKSTEAHSHPPITDTLNMRLAREQRGYLPEVIYHGLVLGIQRTDVTQ